MNKIVLITGATSGIGQATALGLARKGYSIFIAVRNEEKAKAMINLLEANRQDVNQRFEYIIMDLASLDSVLAGFNKLIELTSQLYCLINNAGGLFTQYKETKDGFETALQVNHLSHFLLTNKIIEHYKTKGLKRIINLASEAHRFSWLNFRNIGMKGLYIPFMQYGNTKLMNILFTRELKHRFENNDISFFSLHPGVVRTNFGKNWYGILGIPFKILQFFSITPEQAAETPIYLANS